MRPIKSIVSDMLDSMNPGRICARVGHDFVGFMSMGPHDDNGDPFYALRYRIICTCCKRTLDRLPRNEWPGDGQVRHVY